MFYTTTRVSQYQKAKTNLDLNEARDDRVLGMAVASAGPYASNLHLAIDRSPHQHLKSNFMGRMLFLTPNQQCQSTVSTKKVDEQCQQIPGGTKDEEVDTATGNRCRLVTELLPPVTCRSLAADNVERACC